MEVNDHAFCLCADNYCGSSSFPATSRENPVTGHEVQQSLLPQNSIAYPRHAMHRHHGTTGEAPTGGPSFGSLPDC